MARATDIYNLPSYPEQETREGADTQVLLREGLVFLRKIVEKTALRIENAGAMRDVAIVLAPHDAIVLCTIFTTLIDDVIVSFRQPDAETLFTLASQSVRRSGLPVPSQAGR